MTCKTGIWPVKSAIMPDIVRWLAVICSPAPWQKIGFGICKKLENFVHNNNYFFVFATLLTTETRKVFRLRSCVQNKMTWQRTAVKEQRRLSPDKKLWASKFSQRHLWSVKKIVCTRNDLQNKQNFALCEKGLTHIKFNQVTNFFYHVIKKNYHINLLNTATPISVLCWQRDWEYVCPTPRVINKCCKSKINKWKTLQNILGSR